MKSAIPRGVRLVLRLFCLLLLGIGLVVLSSLRVQAASVPSGKKAAAQRPAVSQAINSPKVVPAFKTLRANFNPWNARWIHGEWGGPDKQGTVYGLAWEDLLDWYESMGVKEIIVPVQWRDVNPKPDVYDWDLVDAVLKRAKARGMTVWLVVGVKSNLDPQTYLREDLVRLAELRGSSDLNASKTGGVGPEVLKWIEKVIVRYRNNPDVLGFQVEHDPLVASGRPAYAIPYHFLEEECSLANRLVKGTSKKLQVTTGAGLTGRAIVDLPGQEAMVSQLTKLPVHRVGLNAYHTAIVPDELRLLVSQPIYRAEVEVWASLKRQFAIVQKAGKTPIVSELQIMPNPKRTRDLNFTDPAGNPTLLPSDLAVIIGRAKQYRVATYLQGLEFISACDFTEVRVNNKKKRGQTTWLAALKKALGVR